MVDDAVVLHFAVAAHTQGVVAGEVGALAHQEQARLRGGEQALGLVPRDLPVEPSGADRKGGGGRGQRTLVLDLTGLWCYRSDRHAKQKSRRVKLLDNWT